MRATFIIIIINGKLWSYYDYDVGKRENEWVVLNKLD